MAVADSGVAAVAAATDDVDVASVIAAVAAGDDDGDAATADVAAPAAALNAAIAVSPSADVPSIAFAPTI